MPAADEAGLLPRAAALEPGVVRGVIRLEGGARVIVARLHSSQLWDTEPEALVRELAGCVHGLSADERVYAAFIPWPEAAMEVRRLDGEALLLRWAHPAGYGIEKVLFSPNGRFLAVRFSSTHPVPDALWGSPAEHMKAVACVALFDLERGLLLEAFGLRLAEGLGRFTADSRLYRRPGAGGSAPRDFDLERGDWAPP